MVRIPKTCSEREGLSFGYVDAGLVLDGVTYLPLRTPPIDSRRGRQPLTFERCAAVIRSLIWAAESAKTSGG